MRGNHVAVRVPDFEASRKWFVEKLDFRVLREWSSDGMRLAYVAPQNDDAFQVEIIGGNNPNPNRKYSDVPESFGGLDPWGQADNC